MSTQVNSGIRGSFMSDHSRIPSEQGEPNTGGPMSRRSFGQAIGAAALGNSLQAVHLGNVSAAPVASAEPRPEQARGRGGELVHLSAVELAAQIRRKQVSAREVMAAHLAQIELVNPKVNAIVTLVGDR